MMHAKKNTAHAFIVFTNSMSCSLAIDMQPTKVTMPESATKAWKKLGLLVVNDKLGDNGQLTLQRCRIAVPPQSSYTVW